VQQDRQRRRRLIRPVSDKKKPRPKPIRARDCDTGKRRYRDQAEATNAIHLFQNWSQRTVVPVRTYACDRCQGWHTTSWETFDG
jgi:hypothetical protein